MRKHNLVALYMEKLQHQGSNPHEKFLSESWLNRLLNLSEFQLNHMISFISELLLKFGRIQPIFRNIQICVSEKFRFAFQLF